MPTESGIARAGLPSALLFIIFFTAALEVTSDTDTAAAAKQNRVPRNTDARPTSNATRNKDNADCDVVPGRRNADKRLINPVVVLAFYLNAKFTGSCLFRLSSRLHHNDCFVVNGDSDWGAERNS